MKAGAVGMANTAQDEGRLKPAATSTAQRQSDVGRVGETQKTMEGRTREVKLHALKGGAFREGVSLRLCPLRPD
jgi:hypothetical protein